MRILILFFIFVISTGLVFAQTNDSETAQAKEVLQKYYEAINFKKNENWQPKISVRYENFWQTTDGEEIFSLEEVHLLDKQISTQSKNSPGSMFSTRKAVLNGNSFYREYIAGKAPKESILLNLSKPKDANDSEVSLLKWTSLKVLFPIILETSNYKISDLKHIGIAESNNKKADVLEGTIDNRTVQLLFDNSTHLLIMWKLTWKLKDNTDKTYNFYLTDYKNFSGIKTAEKVEIYEDNKFKERNVIKDVQNDVNFPSDFFTIKK